MHPVSRGGRGRGLYRIAKGYRWKDWEGSCASSDPMEVTVGMSLGVVDQLNGHEAA